MESVSKNHDMNLYPPSDSYPMRHVYLRNVEDPFSGDALSLCRYEMIAPNSDICRGYDGRVRAESGAEQSAAWELGRGAG